MLSGPMTFRNGVRAKNRVWLAPMTNQQSHDDGSLSDAEHDWLAMRSRSGFGVVETCAAHVGLDGQGWAGELGIYDDALLPGLRRLAGTLAGDGAVGLVQIFHGGVRAPSSLTGKQPWSASSFEAKGAETPRAATEEDILRVIGQFGEAAARAEAAGFAGVELHGAHGYLLCQFLSATMNPREDGWGASLEGRARLIREAMRAARAAVKPGFLVGVRLSPEDFGNARGLDLDESVQVGQWLCEDGADFIHLSLWDSTKNTTKRPEVHAVTLFRGALPRRSPSSPRAACGRGPTPSRSSRKAPPRWPSRAPPSRTPTGRRASRTRRTSLVARRSRPPSSRRGASRRGSPAT